jgi:hypothetical protein
VVHKGINCIPTLKVTVDYMKNGVDKYCSIQVFLVIVSATKPAAPLDQNALPPARGLDTGSKAGRGEVQT